MKKTIPLMRFFPGMTGHINILTRHCAFYKPHHTNSHSKCKDNIIFVKEMGQNLTSCLEIIASCIRVHTLDGSDQPDAQITTSIVCCIQKQSSVNGEEEVQKTEKETDF